jgi:hypothetical protein
MENLKKVREGVEEEGKSVVVVEELPMEKPDEPKHIIQFFFGEIESYAQKIVFKDITAHLKEEDADPGKLKLPPHIATSDAMGHTKPVCREPAKKILKFMKDDRKLQAHLIPKVTMGGDGMDNLKKAAALEILKYNLEEQLLDERKDELFAKVRAKSIHLYHHADNYIIEDAIARAQVLAKQDELRYVTEMENYIETRQCACASKGTCNGFRCLCCCYFCLQDRKHVIAKCDCSKPERKFKAREILPYYNPKEPSHCPCEQVAHAQSQGKLKQKARNYSACAIRGCSCCCGYCLRMKSNYLEMTKFNDEKYCPCFTKDICIGYGCPCACFKCASEKSLLGYCPQQQFL